MALNTSSSSSTSIYNIVGSDLVLDLLDKSTTAVSDDNSFHNVVLEKWSSAAAKGTLNYALEQPDCHFRQLEGEYAFSLQLNEDRCRKRRKPQPFNSITQPFDPQKWNFNRLRPEECLLTLKRVKRAYAAAEEEKDREDGEQQEALLSVNASPLCVGHCLLIPSPALNLPQLLTANGARWAIELTLLTRQPSLVVIFNSLMAHASVNHLHVQSLLWPTRSGLMAQKLNPLPPLYPAAGVHLLRPPKWYLPAFVFQLDHLQNIRRMARQIAAAAQVMAERGFAHNLFISRAEALHSDNNSVSSSTAAAAENDIKGQVQQQLFVTAFLFPRRASSEGIDPAAAADGQSNDADGTKTTTTTTCFASTFVPAALELAGLLPVYDALFFRTSSEQSILQLFRQHSLISMPQFEQLVLEVRPAVSCFV